MTLHVTRLFVAFASILLGGCVSSTIREEKEAELKVLRQALGASQDVLQELKTGQIPPEFDVHLFLSHTVVNKALASLEDYRFPLPDDPSITIQIRGLRLAN